jgi:hypothetical protein
MKAKEFINEGLWGDMVKLGQQQQAATIQQLKQTVKDKVTPNWYKELGAKVAAQQSAQSAGQLSKAWQTAWAQEVEKTNAANTTPLTDDEYRARFATWLEKNAKVRVDPAVVARYIPNQNINNVGVYFSQHFIPAYMKMQSDPQGGIPDGFTLQANTATTVAGQTPTSTKETYKWNARTDQWLDSRGQAVDGTSELYKQLTQGALSGTIQSGQTLKGRYGQTSNSQTV